MPYRLLKRVLRQQRGRCGNDSGNKRSDYGKTHQHTRLLQRSRSRTDRNIQQRPCHPPDIAGHIFIPFFTTKENGSGIGLSISRQIMRLSGGSSL